VTVGLDKFIIFKQLGYEPHPIQREIHASAAPRRVVAAGVRFGKTQCAAHEAVAASIQPSSTPRRGWIVAPNYDLADKVYREILLMFRTHLAPLVLVDREHERYLLVRNSGGGTTEIRGKTAENPVSLLGEGLDWLVVDEAARLKPDVWERYLSARLIDRRGWAMLISTPKGKGWYYDAWCLKRAGWQSWCAPTLSNPHISSVEVEAVRARVPEAVFRQEFEAAFLEGAGAVFRNVRELASAELEEPRAGERYWAGLDLAKVEDFTVLVVVRRPKEEPARVVHVDRFNRLDWEIQTTRVKAALDRYNHAEVLVDSTGAGEPVYEGMRRAGLRARPYKFTTASKADLVNNLALMLEKRQIVLPKPELAPELIEELEAFEFSVTEAGTVRTGAPAGQHDDCAVAMALAAWMVRRPQVAAEAFWA